VPDLRRHAQQRARWHDRHAGAGAHVQFGIRHRKREADVPVRPDLAMPQRIGSQLKTREVGISPVTGSQEFHRKAGLLGRRGFAQRENAKKQLTCQCKPLLSKRSCEGIQLWLA
jgi:hypothetical protein